MFGTLRQADSAHETFCSEPTLPPFQGKRQGKLAQIACVACRASKLKCSAEPDGCQRCANRNTPCSYPRPPKLRFKRARIPIQDDVHPPKAMSGQVREGNSVAGQPTTSNDQDHCSTRYSDLGIITPESSGVANDKALSTRIDLLSADAPLPNFPIDLSTHPNPDVDLMMRSWVDASPNPSIFPFDFSADETADSVEHTESIGGISTSSQTPSSPTSKMEHAECLKQLVQALDTAEINLVWDLCDHSEVKNDILKTQTQSLTDCAALAECPSCIKESTYVTAILSLASKILNSLIVVCSMATDSPYEHVEINHQWLETGDSGCATRSVPKHSRGWRPSGSEVGYSALDQFDVGNERDLAVGGMRYGIGNKSGLLMFGQWHLDEEDELKILQTLLTSRLERLAKVFGGVESQISLCDWPNHKAMCGRLRKRLSSCATRIRAISQNR